MSDRAAVPDPADVAATFCATLVDEWVRGGVQHAVVAPGSRSTPLAVAVVADGRLAVEVHHDERSAGFLALGIGAATGRPAVVITTSGTAAVELHPAVVEAHQGGVPLIACTADRPPELQDAGAPQTVDQTHLYGRSVRWAHQPGVPEWAARSGWRGIGARSVVEAAGRAGSAAAGPVHLDLAFREPLLGSVVDLPAGRSGGRPWAMVSATEPAGGPDDGAEAEPIAGPRGVIVAGGRTPLPEVLALAVAAGWPVLADPRSGVHADAARGAVVVAGFDPIVRVPGADLRPEVVVWVGDRPASKVLAGWVAASGAVEVAVPGSGRWIDPAASAAVVVHGPAGPALAHLASTAGAADPAWSAAWTDAAGRAADVVDRVLGSYDEPTEPGVARTLTRVCADASADLVVSSSMPIRDVEWFGQPGGTTRVLANRGANGIDGVLSTAVGVAVANRTAGRGTALLIGDVAFLHDANGLLGVVRRGIDLTVVVVDNDGGGIFSFLPQRRTLDADRFEQLFGTPHGVDLGALAAAHQVPTTVVTESSALAPALQADLTAGGVRLVLVRTDRLANVEVHGALDAAVAAELG